MKQEITDFSNCLFADSFSKALEEFGKEESGNLSQILQKMNAQESMWALLEIRNQEVLGFIQYGLISLKHKSFEKACGTICEFWIAPAYRKHGIGAALLASCESILRQRGAKELLLAALPSAQAFYEKHGYAINENVQSVNGLKVMHKTLIF